MEICKERKRIAKKILQARQESKKNNIYKERRKETKMFIKKSQLK